MYISIRVCVCVFVCESMSVPGTGARRTPTKGLGGNVTAQYLTFQRNIKMLFRITSFPQEFQSFWLDEPCRWLAGSIQADDRFL